MLVISKPATKDVGHVEEAKCVRLYLAVFVQECEDLVIFRQEIEPDARKSETSEQRTRLNKCALVVLLDYGVRSP